MQRIQRLLRAHVVEAEVAPSCGAVLGPVCNVGPLALEHLDAGAADPSHRLAGAGRADRLPEPP
eukprot:1467672-Lingulodinium_polyedra.AAC.1